MKTSVQATAGTGRIEIRAHERESFTEYHVTANTEGAVPAGTAAEALFAQVAPVLAQHGIQPLQEKLYGVTHVREAVLAQRAAAYRAFGLDRSMPVTWIEGQPVGPCDFTGVQLWGIAPRNGEPCVRTVEDPFHGHARLWEGAGFRLLHLPCVRGTDATGTLVSGPARQARQMFHNVGDALAAHGFEYPNVIRTWIYASRLLDWYGDFNRVRTAHYRRVGLGVEGGPAFPASTGIQGRCDSEECLIDVLALDSRDPARAVAIPIRSSPRQDQSFHYGSAFSRGMNLDLDGRRTVFVSGTASINSAGATTHSGDPEGQSLETLLNIAALLEQQGGALKNITSATVFCKTRAAWEAWNRVTRLLQLPAFPRIHVLADVCRSDLLVEMEAVAVI